MFDSYGMDTTYDNYGSSYVGPQAAHETKQAGVDMTAFMANQNALLQQNANQVAQLNNTVLQLAARIAQPAAPAPAAPAATRKVEDWEKAWGTAPSQEQAPATPQQPSLTPADVTQAVDHRLGEILKSSANIQEQEAAVLNDFRKNHPELQEHYPMIQRIYDRLPKTMSPIERYNIALQDGKEFASMGFVKQQQGNRPPGIPGNGAGGFNHPSGQARDEVIDGYRVVRYENGVPMVNYTYGDERRDNSDYVTYRQKLLNHRKEYTSSGVALPTF
jgi:hypothetical protein